MSARGRLIACLAGLGVLLVTLAAGLASHRWSADPLLEAIASPTALPTAALATATPQPLPAADVPGADLPGLPRYPGSVRVSFESEASGDLTSTEVEYQTPVGVDYVRDYYREVFRAQDWSVADVSFSDGVWSFFVVQGDREARLEIEACPLLTCIAIHLSEPLLPDGSAAETDIAAAVVSPRTRPVVDALAIPPARQQAL